MNVVFAVPRWSARWVLEDGVTMPESSEHRATCEALEDILRTWTQRTGRDAAVFGNIALRWDEAHPAVGVDPDVCVVAPAPSEPDVRSVRTWVAGHAAPMVAIEVVSRDTAAKDYLDGPPRYAASGVGELWIFDPARHGRGLTGESSVLQVWQRSRSGDLLQVYAGDGPAYSEALGGWLVVTDKGTRLRVSDDEAGTALWPTAAERERARAEAAEDEVARLRAALAAVTAGR